MECLRMKLQYSDRKYKYISAVRKGNVVNFQTFLASVTLCLIFISSVLCESDWSSSPLTFDQIYNNTRYAQIQDSQIRPYNVTDNYSPKIASRFYDEDGNRNDVEEFRLNDKFEINNKDQLLVGFSHDPFRPSIPEADYLKGVRNIDPQQYLNKGDRGKRGVVHLYNMLTCATGCDPISYKGYGCYCGFGGSGRPTDGIDNCCKLHDQCYENIYCPFYTVYFQPYYWKCYHGQPLCALENYQSRHQFINGCAAKLCECDRRFTMCIRRYSCPRGRALCKSSPLRLFQNLIMFR